MRVRLTASVGADVECQQQQQSKLAGREGMGAKRDDALALANANVNKKESERSTLHLTYSDRRELVPTLKQHPVRLFVSRIGVHCHC